jgi:hypothetical protein
MRFNVSVLEGPVVHKLNDWRLPCSTPFLLHLYLFQVVSLLRVRPEAFLDCNDREVLIADEHNLTEQHTLTSFSILALGRHSWLDGGPCQSSDLAGDLGRYERSTQDYRLLSSEAFCGFSAGWRSSR